MEDEVKNEEVVQEPVTEEVVAETTTTDPVNEPVNDLVTELTNDGDLVDTLTKELKELREQFELLKSEKEEKVENPNVEEPVVETETTKEEPKEEDKPVSNLDPETVKRLDERLAEIRQLKEDMAKLHRANDFASSSNSTTQNNQKSRSLSDEDIRKFWWKI